MGIAPTANHHSGLDILPSGLKSLTGSNAIQRIQNTVDQPTSKQTHDFIGARIPRFTAGRSSEIQSIL